MEGGCGPTRLRSGLALFAAALVVACAASGCRSWGDDGSPGPARWWDPHAPAAAGGVTATPRRLGNASPWFTVSPDDLELHAAYSARDEWTGERVVCSDIHAKAMRMIRAADRCVVMTAFLFDNLYATNPPPRDVVGEFTDALIAQKRRHPEMTVVLLLDPMHRGWGQRASPAVEALRDAGVDVFYSDPLDTASATRLPAYETAAETWRWVNTRAAGLPGRALQPIGRLPLPLVFRRLDGDAIRVQTVLGAATLKANHRKLVVTASGDQWEALIGSANPHNASAAHEDYAVSLRGAPATYLYMVQRADAMRSAQRGGAFCDGPTVGEGYFTHRLPPVPIAPPDHTQSSTDLPRVMLATEAQIEAGVLAMLDGVAAGDEVRVQMFYLARVPVIHGLLDAARRTDRPVRLLLDANRVGIGYPKDGTPNAQVAAYLMDRARAEGLDVEVRWYATDGEQNHAKILSVTNADTGKFELTTGSANWTRKNLAGINLEANVFVVGAPHINTGFDTLFDRMWHNADPGLRYSVAWDDPDHDYHRHAGLKRWASQPGRWLPFAQRDDGRPILVEREWVHW